MMNAVAHMNVNATQASVLTCTIVHVQKVTFELFAILMLAAQLSDVSHVNTLLPNQHQTHESSLTLHQMMSLAHHLTHVMIAGVMNDSTETAGHQKLAHTVNATLTDKSVVVRPNVQP
jgi:hypothetical protein